jgi:hypothetical protein
VLVGEDVCVASTATVGMGGVVVFEREGGGVDVDWSDERRAPKSTPRLIVEGDIGLGLLEVRHSGHVDHGPGRRLNGEHVAERNDACATRTASRDSGASNG